MAEPAETRTNSRSALVDAAFAEFTTKGYEAATVAGIADRAGVTTGAVYAHFAGKLDLLLATVGLTPIAEIVRADGSRGRAAMAARLARGLAERPDARRVLLLDVIVAARRDPKVAEILRGGLEAYVRATARALGATEGVSRLLAVLNLGMVVLAAMDARTPPSAEFGGLVELLLPPPPPSPGGGGGVGGVPGAGGAPAGAADPLARVRAAATAAEQAEAALRDAVAAAVDDGLSLRQVGAAAGRSHEAVRRMAVRRGST